MKKNLAGQHIGALIVNASTGAAITTGVTVQVTGDGGALANSAGVLTHLGSGYWDYAPTQAETNYSEVTYLFNATSAVPKAWILFPDDPLPANFSKLAIDANGLVTTNVNITGSLSGGGTVTQAPANEIDVQIKVANPTAAQSQQIAAMLGVGGTGGGTTPVNYFPTDPGSAPFPSPENSTMIVLAGKPSGVPYLRDLQGAIWQWAMDASGNVIPYTDASGFSGYNISVNGVVTTTATVTELIVRQGQVYHFYGGGVTGKYNSLDDPLSGTTQVPLPPAWTSTGGGTTQLPPMPADPSPASVASGSSGNTILFGTGQTFTTLSAAVAAAQPGDTVKAVPSMSGVVLSESVAITVPIVIDGGGTVANAGTINASFSGGAVLDGISLTDPSGYQHQLGGFVPMTDCVIKGFEIRGFGLKETGAGLTSGIRNGAQGIFSVDNCWIHDNQNGIGSGTFAANWTVTNTLFRNNGIGDGSTHNMYFTGGCVRVTMDGGVTSIVDLTGTSSVTGTGKTNGGHALKTRAAALTIAGTNYFQSTEATDIDVPNGTTLPFSISGATILAKLAGDTNHGVFGYGVENQNNGLAGGTFNGITFSVACPTPFIQTLGGPITATGCTVIGGPIVIQGGGTVTGL